MDERNLKSNPNQITMLIKDLLGPSRAIHHTNLLTPSSPDMRSLSNSNRLASSPDLLSSPRNRLASSADIIQSQASNESPVSGIGSFELLHSQSAESSVLSRILNRNLPTRAMCWNQIIQEAMMSTERESGGHIVAVTVILTWVMQNMGKCIDGFWEPLPISSRKDIGRAIRYNLRKYSPALFIVEQAAVKSYSLNPLASLESHGKSHTVEYFYAPLAMAASVAAAQEYSDGPISDPYENCVSDEPEPQYVFMQPPENIHPSLEEVAWCFAGMRESSNEFRQT
jgi:hypothetical protein